MNITWNEKKVEFLRECADKNMSGSAIAELMTSKFKENYTRNAIIGKANREKISFNRVYIKPPVVEIIEEKPKTNKKAVKKAVKRAVKKAVKEEVKEEVKKEVLQEKIIICSPFKNPLSSPTKLLDLVEGQCKYPTGDVRTNDLFFCGAPADSFRSRTYCSYCYPILYQPRAKYRASK